MATKRGKTVRKEPPGPRPDDEAFAYAVQQLDTADGFTVAEMAAVGFDIDHKKIFRLVERLVEAGHWCRFDREKDAIVRTSEAEALGL